MKIIINTINEFCKMYRKKILQLTLKEMEDKTGVKTSTLSSFENGRSTNINHLTTYYNLGNEEQKEYFKNNIPYDFRG